MIKIAISPCPNDIFNFYGLLTGRLTLSFPYEIHIKPLHELNKYASTEDYHFLKTSFLTYFKHQGSYRLCSLGHSITSKVGPVVFAREQCGIEDLKELVIGTAGDGTVGDFLVNTLFKGVKTVPMAFSEIIPNLQKSKIDAGVVIHEARTESDKLKLYKICDLTELWYQKYHLPTPLGAFLAQRSLSSLIYSEFMRALEKSKSYAAKNQEKVFTLAKKYSQEQSREAIAEHISHFSLDQNYSEKELETLVGRFQDLVLDRKAKA